MSKANISNLYIISIANNYENNRLNILKSVNKDIENMKSLVDINGLQSSQFNNLDLEPLKNSLEKLVSTLKNNRLIDTIIIYYSGHGSYSANNDIAAIVAQDNRSLYLTEIFQYFYFIENLYCIFDACRSYEDNHSSINFEKISNKRVILTFPTAKGVGAYGNPAIGGFYSYFFLNLFKKEFFRIINLP